MCRQCQIPSPCYGRVQFTFRTRSSCTSWLPNKILKAIKICQLQERKWLMKTYPSTDSTEDARLIAEMCRKFNEAQSNNITARPPPPSTGSASSSFPLNKKEDNEESSTWTTGKRQGMFAPEKDFYDQS